MSFINIFRQEQIYKKNKSPKKLGTCTKESENFNLLSKCQLRFKLRHSKDHKTKQCLPSSLTIISRDLLKESPISFLYTHR